MFATTEAPKSLPIQTHIIVLRQRLGAVHCPNSGDHIEMSACLCLAQEADFTKILLLIRHFESVALTNSGTGNRGRYTIGAQRLIVVNILIFPANHWNICISTRSAVKRTRRRKGISRMRSPPCATVNVVVYEGIYHRAPCGGQEQSIAGMVRIDMRKRLSIQIPVKVIICRKPRPNLTLAPARPLIGGGTRDLSIRDTLDAIRSPAIDTIFPEKIGDITEDAHRLLRFHTQLA